MRNLDRDFNEYKLYRKMYMFLFNAVTDALEELPDEPGAAKTRLMLAQIKCEKMYIEAEEDTNE